MLPGEPKPPVSGLRKLKPLAKLPTSAVLHMFTPTDVRRLKRLLNDPVEYVDDPRLDDPALAPLLGGPQDPCLGAPRSSDDSGFCGFAADLPVPTLDREHALFLRLNYWRRRVYRLMQEQAGRRLSADTAALALQWEHEAAVTRGEIVRDNMPLVLAMAKRTRITGVDVTDLISEGNLALLRAVNKFDCSRGYKFSTYACRAILKSFSRVATRMARYRGHFPTEFDPALEKSNHLEQTRLVAEGDAVHELKTILADNRAQLTDVEQKVVAARFALDIPEADADTKAKTLEQVGEMIGVTKERVRQIQNKALSKLRVALEQMALAR